MTTFHHMRTVSLALAGVLTSGAAFAQGPGEGSSPRASDPSSPAAAPAPIPAPGPGRAPPAAGMQSAPGGEAGIPGALPPSLLEAAPGGLLPDEVARAAAHTSHEAKAKDADVAAAEAGMKQAWLGYFPRLSLVAQYTRLSPVTLPPIGVAPDGTPITLPVFLNNGVFQATVAVPLTDLFLRIPQAYASAKDAANAARFSAEATRLQTALDARTTYYGWVRIRTQVLVAELALEQVRAHLKIVKAHESPGDVARVESQLAATELVVERAKGLATVTEDRLRTLMHDTSGRPYELGEGLAAALPPFPRTELPALWEEAGRQRLEVRALGELLESQREQTALTRAGLWPRLDAVANLYAANPNQRIFPPVGEFRTTWDVTLRLSWSPNDAATTLRAVDGVDAKTAAFREQRAALLDGLRSEVTASYNGVREADVAVETTARGVTAAEESYRIRLALFKVGRATSVELTDAEADLTRARVEAVGARIDQRLARARLLHALGRDVGSLAEPAAAAGPRR